MKNSIKFLFFCSVILLASCATYQQTSELSPLDSSVPVSASSSLRIQQETISVKSYEVIDTFQFEKHLRSQYRNTSPIPLDLNEDIRRIKEQYGADAVVELTIRLKEIRSGGIGWIQAGTFTGFIGAGLAFNGLMRLIIPPRIVSESGMESTTQDMLTFSFTAGSILTVAGFGGALLQHSTGKFTYVYEITGKAVRITKDISVRSP